MRALMCQSWGDPDTLTIEPLHLSPPAAGEVQIRVRACGVNFADALMIQGQYQVRPPFPFSPGLEVAGSVLATGDGVRHLRPGQRVLGLCSWGGMAEAVNTSGDLVMPIPDSLDYVQAVTMVTYGTSHVALEHRARLQPGETLLVLGAAGGVGITAVELGKRLGATVIAAASTPQKLALAEQYGADHLINYQNQDLRTRLKEITGGRGVDVVYDPVGGPLFDSALRSMAWEGRLLVIGFASGTIPQVPANLALVKNCSIIGVYWGAYAQHKPQVLRQSLETLMGWLTDGELKPHISQTLPLESGAEAIWSLMRRQATGKVVVTVD